MGEMEGEEGCVRMGQVAIYIKTCTKLITAVIVSAGFLYDPVFYRAVPLTAARKWFPYQLPANQFVRWRDLKL